MKNTTFKLISLVLAVVMLFSMSIVAFATETKSTDDVAEFGDILYSDDGITVFYGNPSENEELAEQIEAEASRSLQYNNIWVDANTSTTRTMSIQATTSNPLTYFTVKQEAESPVISSRVVVKRPTGDGECLVAYWNERADAESNDNVISTSTLWDQWPFDKYEWTTGYLTATWYVTTGDSGARLCMWAW